MSDRTCIQAYGEVRNAAVGCLASSMGALALIARSKPAFAVQLAKKIRLLKLIRSILELKVRVPCVEVLIVNTFLV